ncbi:MAG: recombinase family protein [Sphaerochaetaceae bacterium]|nr:recombinase family protein [Sphaerochaetaceae bacterium]
MRVYSYIRLTGSDNDARFYQDQVAAFASENKLGKVQFVVEQTSLVKDWEKTQLGILANEASKDDLVIVPTLMMLSRSLIQVCEIMRFLHRKEVWIAAIDQKLTITGEKSEFNSGIITCLGFVSEYERKLVSIRMKETLDRQKSLGMKVGRPVGSGKSALDPHREEILKARNDGVSGVMIARMYKTTPQNISKWLKKQDAKQAIECQMYCVSDDETGNAAPRQENLGSAEDMVSALVGFACETAGRNYTDRDVMLISNSDQGSYIFISDSELRTGFILSWPMESDALVMRQMHALGITSLE